MISPIPGRGVSAVCAWQLCGECMASRRAGACARVRGAGRACARAFLPYAGGSRRIFPPLGRLAWSIGNYSSQAAFRMRFILPAPR
jgi:hypothetical protein